eukprot:6808306-Pyramimonas_sp.AAC.2
MSSQYFARAAKMSGMMDRCTESPLATRSKTPTGSHSKSWKPWRGGTTGRNSLSLALISDSWDKHFSLAAAPSSEHHFDTTSLIKALSEARQARSARSSCRQSAISVRCLGFDEAMPMMPSTCCSGSGLSHFHEHALLLGGQRRVRPPELREVGGARPAQRLLSNEGPPSASEAAVAPPGWKLLAGRLLHRCPDHVTPRPAAQPLPPRAEPLACPQC